MNPGYFFNASTLVGLVSVHLQKKNVVRVGRYEFGISSYLVGCPILASHTSQHFPYVNCRIICQEVKIAIECLQKLFFRYNMIGKFVTCSKICRYPELLKKDLT